MNAMETSATMFASVYICLYVHSNSVQNQFYVRHFPHCIAASIIISTDK